MEARDRMRAARDRASPPQRERGEANAGQGVPVPRVGTVRLTVDLARPIHKALRQFALDLDSDASSVVRALLMELQSDQGLAERIRRSVPPQRGKH